MAKIDTSGWKEFVIGDLFEKLNLGIKNPQFNKALDVSEEQTDEFNLPLVNAKHGNNGIMFYGRKEDFETASMTIDIVQNGAIATGDVYAQPQETGVLWDAYLIKPKHDIKSEYTLMFLAVVIERAIKERFSYDDKCVWDKASLLKVELPVDSHVCPDWAYMDSFMAEVMKESEACLENLRLADEKKTAVDVSGWKEFEIGKLFPKIKKPPVLHNRQVIEDENGIPYVVRTKFDNGIKCRVQRSDEMKSSPAGVISFGAENATFFYQHEEFVSGRDIYYIDTQDLSDGACMFLTACLQPIARKYSYNYGLFPDLLKSEQIKLPVDSHGCPDWAYMDSYMRVFMQDAESNIEMLSKSLS